MNTPNTDALIDSWQDSEKGAALDDISHALWVLRKDLQREPDDIKPIWHPPVEFAPHWARWAAFGENGSAFWYGDKPTKGDIYWRTHGCNIGIGYVPESIRHLWRDSLVEVNHDSE